MRDGVTSSPASAAESVLPPYEPPQIRLLDEEEVLSTFQVTQAGFSWWIY